MPNENSTQATQPPKKRRAKWCLPLVSTVLNKSTHQVHIATRPDIQLAQNIPVRSLPLPPIFHKQSRKQLLETANKLLELTKKQNKIITELVTELDAARAEKLARAKQTMKLPMIVRKIASEQQTHAHSRKQVPLPEIKNRAPQHVKSKKKPAFRV